MVKIEKFVVEYKCTWPPCVYAKPFEKVVGKGYGPGSYERPAKYVSDQVVCPKCGNHLRTWDDGKVIKELK